MDQLSLQTFLIPVLILLAVLGWLVLKRQKKRNRYERLLRKCFGDEVQAERLIEAEQHRYPKGNRDLWIRLAIERWEQHSR
jgi:hypothetical protein